MAKSLQTIRHLISFVVVAALAFQGSYAAAVFNWCQATITPIKVTDNWLIELPSGNYYLGYRTLTRV